ncbi:hypothetical protein B1H18_29505 [Streptomyces tsukubensis]|uniref:Uncharacterized protein n=1 Tax=Streptomyces tsukubensis TaxID=83656 RepID=A0A1V4A1W8_9ACTN|nr:hypothetical protein B1H18_29505 [Streptomyces tsukubensis]
MRRARPYAAKVTRPHAGLVTAHPTAPAPTALADRAAVTAAPAATPRADHARADHAMRSAAAYRERKGTR